MSYVKRQEIVDKIDIKIDFYDISDELLFENEDFKEIVKQYDLEFRNNSVGYKID